MRVLIAFISCFFLANSSLIACTCFGFSFCDELNDYIETDGAIIFMGSFIKEDSIGWSRAMQFKVEKVYRGEIVTPSSPLFTAQTYTNTDSTVWLLSGASASCHRWITHDKAIFAVFYDSGFPNFGEPFGYVPTICRNDYFKVSPDETITGRIWDRSEEVTMSLVDFEDVILKTCRLSAVEDINFYSKNTTIYPNPSNDVTSINTSFYLKDWDVSLVDAKGSKIKTISGSRVNLSELNSGLYFIVFARRESKFAKKIIKI